MGAVIALGLIHIGQAREHHRRLRGFGCGHSLGDLPVCGCIRCGAVALGIGDLQTFGRFKRGSNLKAVDMGAAAALVSGLFGKLADEGDFVVLIQRQKRVLVLEQHHAVGRDLGGEHMLCLLVPGGIGPGVFRVAEDDIQNALHRLIHQLLVQPSGLDSVNDLAVVDAIGGGHLQIETRGHARRTVGHRAPVAHHIALKAPLIAQYLGQKPRVFGGVDAV